MCVWRIIERGDAGDAAMSKSFLVLFFEKEHLSSFARAMPE